MVIPRPSRDTRWRFPTGADEIARMARGTDLVAVGADLEPSTLLAAYRAGIFPMPWEARTTSWWSPDPRAILPLDGLKVSRSLRRSLRRFEIRVDTAFDDVIAACADPAREGAWIDRSMGRAYRRLHRAGWAHSVEAWVGSELAGGLYGVSIGGLFAGESMFHRRPDASKAALVALVRLLRGGGAVLLDVQWLTAHLATLGALEVSRARYHELLEVAVALEPMNAFEFGIDPAQVGMATLDSRQGGRDDPGLTGDPAIPPVPDVRG